LPVNQQILKTFCLLQVTDFFDTFLLELELELELEPEPEPEPPKLKSLEPEPEPPKGAAPTTLVKWGQSCPESIPVLFAKAVSGADTSSEQIVFCS